MAILYAESFDSYANITGVQNALQSISNDIDYLTTGGRWGGGCLNAPNLDAGMLVAMKAAPATNLLRAAWHYREKRDGSHTSSGARAMMSFRNTAGDRFLNFYLSGGLKPANGMTGNRYQSNFCVGRFDDVNSISTAGVAVGNIPIADGQWHHIEIEYVAHTSTGSVKVWIDGILDIDLSGIDTSDAASGDVTTFTRVMMCGSMNNSGSGQSDGRVDDLLVWDDSGSDFTGHLTSPHRLRNVLVNAAGDSAQFTPNTGANDAAVDEATNDDDTTYVESATVGHIDLYNIGDITGTGIGTIKAVIVETIAKDTAAVATHRGKLKSSSTVADGTTSATMANSYRKYQSIFFKDPNGTIDWTESSVEAAQIGQEVMS